MKRFRFRLQPVLQLREMRERRARDQLAAAVQRLVEAEQELIRLRDREQTLAGELRQQRQELHRPGEAVAAQWALDRLAREASVLEARRDEALELRDQAHAIWLQTRLEMKVIERLQERDARHFRDEAVRQEQLQLDEFAVIAAARNLSAS